MFSERKANHAYTKKAKVIISSLAAEFRSWADKFARGEYTTRTPISYPEGEVRFEGLGRKVFSATFAEEHLIVSYEGNRLNGEEEEEEFDSNNVCACFH